MGAKSVGDVLILMLGKRPSGSRSFMLAAYFITFRAARGRLSIKTGSDGRRWPRPLCPRKRTSESRTVMSASGANCGRAVAHVCADFVAKVENRTAPKISRKSVFRQRYLWKAL